MDSPTTETLIQALEKAGAKLPCPRCGQGEFSILEGTSAIPSGSQAVGTINFGQVLPVALVACNHCGFIMQHALGILGLLNNECKNE